ncbi:hypothetical protein GSUB_11545 [Geoalkalibacter subterraneus]|uniref:Uncharacterized protein n=1 Tax=Geoalkalibacter subterraneus TaxID=483547 RepID=A0A0B5FSF7_9BACT|nr:hypothetical protein GSUB_11545 [Geoalkalibacter subterraneus]
MKPARTGNRKAAAGFSPAPQTDRPPSAGAPAAHARRSSQVPSPPQADIAALHRAARRDSHYGR